MHSFIDNIVTHTRSRHQNAVADLDMPRGVLKTGTRSGKTEMGAAIARKLGWP
jgi:hypothetical protein